MSSQNNNINLLKKRRFYGEEINLEPKEFSNVKLLSELPCFDKTIKPKTKHLTTKEILNEQPFYKKSIRKPCTKKLTNQESHKCYHFMMMSKF